VRWLQDLTHSAGRSDVDNLIHLALTRGRSAGMVQVQGRSAPIRYLQLLVSQLHSPAGAQAQTDPRDLVVEGWDITPLVSQHDDLGMRSLRDSLTGTESRTAFTARLDHDLNRSSIGGHRVALLLASVESCTDRVTGSEGDQGNHVLVTLAARFTTTLRPGDTLGRTAADEFGVICPGIADWPALSAVLDRLRAVAGNPIQFSGKDLQATVSIGAIFADEVGHGGGRASALLAHAGHRMFLDKSSERPAPRPTV
jgi:diguanylate cyclase (GGDEF)-like protein